MIKLALYGDSLACPRQNVVRSDERYFALIENFLREKHKSDYLELRDKAIGGATLDQLYSAYKEDNTYYDLPGDYLIIHSGIVDCAPRPIDEETRSRVNRLPGFLKRAAIRYIHNNRAQLIEKNNGGFVRTDPSHFNKTFSTFLEHASANYKMVFIINICPTNSTIENRSPGLSQNIRDYNELIRTSVETISKKNIKLIDIYKILSEKNNINDFIVEEDGHHIHPLAHQLIANEIINLLQTKES